MYSTCLHCHRGLGRNEAIEHFTVGRRLAFDAAKGRLWAVCPRCGRWNLTPIEERWEAVEECERLFRAQRLRAQTDNVGLARVREGTELVRIGAPLRPEFAAWRYGGVFRRRMQRRANLIVGASAAVAAGGIAFIGAPIAAAAVVCLAPVWGPLGVGFIAARGGVFDTRVMGENGKPLRVSHYNLAHTSIVPTDDGPLHVRLRHSYGTQELTGDRADRALATLLARVNRGGGSTVAVAHAADLIVNAGDARRAIATVAREAERRTGDFETRWAEFARGPRWRTMEEAMNAAATRSVADAWRQRNGRYEPVNRGALYSLPITMRLALEMSLHETAEQFALDQELATLERAWREAEEIAAIADAMFAPPLPARKG